MLYMFDNCYALTKLDLRSFATGRVKYMNRMFYNCHALEDVRMFRTGCGGQYGFVSSHAANAFAIVTLLWLRYRRTATWTVALMVLWAIATCYSRAYLGKHYPGDLVCGALFGMVVGLIVWWLTTMIEKKLHKCETK